MKNNNEINELEILLKVREISEHIEGREFYFRDVVSVKSGKSMLQLSDSVFKDRLEMHASKFIEDFNKDPQKYITDYEKDGGVVPGRINEFGNMIEKIFGKYTEENFSDLNRMELGLDTGYPDLLFLRKKVDSNEYIYIEIKTFGEGNKDSSMRSFYYSYGTQNKVNENGVHILIAFETSKEKVIYNSSKKGSVKLPKKLTNFVLKDIFSIKVKLKAEFNTGNNNLYSEEEENDSED